MQLSFIESQQVADMIEQGSLMLRLEGPGSNETLVLNYGGQDIIAIADFVTGNAVVIGPTDPADEAGIHEQARRL